MYLLISRFELSTDFLTEETSPTFSMPSSAFTPLPELTLGPTWTQTNGQKYRSDVHCLAIKQGLHKYTVPHHKLRYFDES